MTKTENDVLMEYAARGWIAEPEQEAPKLLSYIRQARESILCYCNIPVTAAMPDGLFYAWVEISRGMSQGTVTTAGTGAIKSISEGDTSITFDVGTTTSAAPSTAVDYTALLRRFRRLP